MDGPGVEAEIQGSLSLPQSLIEPQPRQPGDWARGGSERVDHSFRASLTAQLVKNPPAMKETPV